MNWKKWLVLTMSSVWFFPVSCTTSALIGIQASFHLGANHHEQGDPVPFYFSVAIFDHPNHGFRVERLSKAASTPISRLRPQGESGSYIIRHDPLTSTRHSYELLDHSKHIVEVISDEDDYTFYSVYRVDAQQITPIYSRVNGIGNGLIGGLLCLPIGILIYELSNWLRRRFYS